MTAERLVPVAIEVLKNVLQRQEENHQPDHIAACRDEFFAALAEMVEDEEMATMPDTYIVLFDFDRSNITAAGAAVIAEVLADAAARGLDQVNVRRSSGR